MIRAALGALGAQIPEGAAEDIAASLPMEIDWYLTVAVAEHGQRFDWVEFVSRVGEVEGVDPPEAAHHVWPVVDLVPESPRVGKFMLANRLAPLVDSPFEVLLIEPDADDEAVERAYRERVKQAHPDQGGTVREFQRVRAAYEEIITAREHGDGFDPGESDASTEREGERAETPHRPMGTVVEYLNYEILADHGWGVGDRDLFEQAASADLDPVNYGEFRVEPGESLLEAAERHDFAWPYACRGGACANCAVVVLEGDLSTPINTVLPREMVDRGIRLSCNGIPTTDEMKVVYNVKHMPDLEDLLLPPRPWEQAHLD